VVLYLDWEYRMRSRTYAVYYATGLLRICMAEDRFSQASEAPLGTIIFSLFSPSRARPPAETPASRYRRNDLLIAGLRERNECFSRVVL